MPESSPVSGGISPAGSGSSVAYAALALAQSNEQAIGAHEDLCAERYGNIHKEIAELKGLFKWGGVTGFGLLMTVLGFLVVQMLNANTEARKAADTKIELLERQIHQQPQVAVQPG